LASIVQVRRTRVAALNRVFVGFQHVESIAGSAMRKTSRLIARHRGRPGAAPPGLRIPTMEDLDAIRIDYAAVLDSVKSLNERMGSALELFEEPI